MKSKNTELAFLSGCLSLLIPTLLSANEWRCAEGGEFMDSARWNPQAVPLTSSQQAIWSAAAQGEYTVLLPSGNWANESQVRVDIKSESSEIKFDGSNTIWAPTTHSSADYAGEPFAFYDLVSHYFSFEMYSDKKGAPYKFTNPVFRASGKGGVSALHFDSGTFNFYDPNSSAHNYDFTIGYGANAGTLIGVHGADVSVANVNIRSSSSHTTLLVDGGSLDAKTKLEIPTASGGNARTRVDIVVTNTGTLKAGYVTLGYNGKMRDINVKVADKGRFELPIPASYKFSQQAAGSTLDWEVSNGGTVYLGHNLAFAWGDGSCANVHLNNGNWLSYNETTIGADSKNVSCVFAATNSFIDAYQNNASAMVRLNKDMIVKDSLWTNNYLYAYGANVSPSLFVEGGKWVNLARLYFGTPDGAKMTIDGGEHEWFGQIYVGYETGKSGEVTFKSGKVTMTSSEMIALGYNGSGTFYINGGEILMPSGGGLSLGHTLQGTGFVKMTGGILSIPSSETGLVVSRYGKGTFLMEGGELIVGKGIWFGHGAREVSDLYKGYFRQTDGRVDAGYVNLCHGNSIGELALDGGVFAVKYIESQGGATAANGIGNAILSADGGKLVPKVATTSFIKKIDGIHLGEKGLTIDTANDVTILDVPISSKLGVKGKLIKQGRGTLTLKCDVADDVEIVVEQGKVVFANSNEIGKLTIGTEISAGAIELASGVSLIVKDKVDIIHNSSSAEFNFTPSSDGSTSVTEINEPAKAIEIRLDEPTVSNATENILFQMKDTLSAVVAEGALLNLAGRFSRGAFVKSGLGKAVLSNNVNEFYGGVLVENGTLAFDNASALGLSLINDGTVTLKNGTLEYLNDEPGETKAKLLVSTSSAKTPVTIKASDDISFNGGLEVSAGALVKGGAGEITVAAINNAAVAVSGSANSTGANGAPQGMTSFNADGSFSGEHGSLTVAEGTLAIKGTGVETVKASGATIAVGVQMTDVDEQPVLKIDGATLDNNMHLFVGGFIQPNSAASWATNATLEIVNGGVVKCDTLRIGYESGSRGNYPCVRVNGGTLDVGFRVNCADHQNNVHSKFVFENGSSYKVGSYNYSSWQTYWQGDAEFIFDNSNYDIAGNNHYGYLYLRDAGRGSMLFRNQSKAYISTIEKLSGDNHRLLLGFDNSEWIPSAGNYDFIFRGGEGITVECQKGNLSLPVPAGATWRCYQKFTGEGGIVKTGAGTLVFEKASYYDTYNNSLTVWPDASSWAFEGVALIKEGILEVKKDACYASSAAILKSGTVFSPDVDLTFGSISGEGKVSGGGLIDTKISGVTVEGTTLTRPTIALSVDSLANVSGAPKFSNCTFNGKINVDFGCSEESPLPDNNISFTLCTFDGASPAIESVKAVNTGLVGVEIQLSLSGNSIVGNLSSHNFTIILLK